VKWMNSKTGLILKWKDGRNKDRMILIDRNGNRRINRLNSRWWNNVLSNLRSIRWASILVIVKSISKRVNQDISNIMMMSAVLDLLWIEHQWY